MSAKGNVDISKNVVQSGVNGKHFLLCSSKSVNSPCSSFNIDHKVSSKLI